jgi:hypothetical protein
MKNLKAILLACALVLSQPLFAQGPPSFNGHYPAGVEGIKAASLPPPGIYLRDYNLFYFADQLNDTRGDKMAMDFDLNAYAQAIRPIWITDVKILGGYYGMDVLVPFIYTDLEVPGASDSSFNLGDVFVEPITLSWHGQRFDAGVGYGFWAPTGEYDQNNLTNPGKGYWGHMLTAGGTFYFDKAKTWALSGLGRYEINTENTDLHITPGQELTFEWGVSKTLAKTWDVGLVGYYQQQVTEDNGHDGVLVSDDLDHVASVGPEVSAFFPKLKLFTSLRYLYEFSASDRPQGNTVTLTLTKIL